MGPGLPKVTPSHGKDQWPSAPAAASPSSCLNFLFNSCVYLVKNANPATPFSYNHTGGESHVCPQPCNTTWVRAKDLNTFLHPLHVPRKVPFPSWWRHSQGIVSQHCNAFPNKLFGVFQDRSSATICLPAHMKRAGFLSVYYSVRTFMCVSL